MKTLTDEDELNLLVDDFGEEPALAKAVREYFEYISNCMVREGLHSFVTSREYA
jgi:hypothetical protein